MSDWPWPDPPGPHVYAQPLAGTIACPRCGELTAWGPWIGRRQAAGGGWARASWDAETSLWRCPRCALRAYVGLTLWPTVARGSTVARPRDHVLTPGQAAELRLHLSSESPRRGRGRHGYVNGVCTCASGCLVHGEGGKDDE